MKKLIAIIAIGAFATGVFAQAPAGKMEGKPATAKTTDATHCYAMKDGAMMHCMGTKAEPMAKDATLNNGAMVSTKGEITMKDGTKKMLANGQCVDMNGKIGDFDKMHPGADMKKEPMKK